MIRHSQHTIPTTRPHTDSHSSLIHQETAVSWLQAILSCLAQCGEGRCFLPFQRPKQPISLPCWANTFSRTAATQFQKTARAFSGAGVKVTPSKYLSALRHSGSPFWSRYERSIEYARRSPAANRGGTFPHHRLQK